MIQPQSIVITTSTLYKNWYSGAVTKKHQVDKIRGNLAIEMLTVALQKGFQLVLVDNGSSQDFLSELQKIGITPHVSKQTTMSGSRRQASLFASKLTEAIAIVWTEPEKISFVKDNLPDTALPVLEDKADIVIPKRDSASFSTYPNYQASIEKIANKKWNQMMRKHNLLSSYEDIDIWFGPRIFKNTPEVLGIFLDRYDFEKRGDQLDEIIDPELWPNALFLPIVAALYRKLRIKSLTVNYTHPPTQTQIEEQHYKFFKEKRDLQYQNIIITTQELLNMLENKPTRLIKVSNK